MPTFKTMEQAGWIEKAPAYDAHFASITRQAIAPLLQRMGSLQGYSVLDVCCGTGDLAAALVAGGAATRGVDFSPTMIEIARTKVPQAIFEAGDAAALPCPDHSVDFVTCSFGMYHLPEPEKAIAEAARVLRPGGTYLYTTWLPPQDGWDMFRILVEAVKRHGTLDVDLPPAPPAFRFADALEAEKVLTTSGFKSITVARETATWVGSQGRDLIDLIYKAIVRAPMIIEAQAPEARQRIRDEIAAMADAMRVDGKISMRWPYVLVTSKRV